MVPLLVLLFVVSYCILTALVFEQGQTIEAQRGLIREMLKDSTQLAALKSKLARDDGRRSLVQDKVQDRDKDAASVTHKKADADNSATGAKAPDAKGSDKQIHRSTKPEHSKKSLPEKPAGDLEDMRRSTDVI